MKFLNNLLDLLQSVAIAGVLSLLISVFVFQPTEVLGNSMQPTLESKEIVFLSKIAQTFNIEPNYGDIVVIDSRTWRERSFKDDFVENPMLRFLTSRKDNHEFWIKRVVGKSGDVIELKDGKVFRNGVLLEEPYILEPMITYNQKVVVPENHVFVMGDNRNHSKDSRQVGPVPEDHVLGKMIFE